MLQQRVKTSGPSCKPRSDVGRREKFNIGNSCAAPIFKNQAHNKATKGNRLARLSAFCSAGDACCFFKPLSAVCRASVIPSALKSKYLFTQAAAPRVCERSAFESAWVRLPRGALIGRVNKSCLPHHNRVLQAAKFSAATTHLYRSNF
jgi:hypothetical protein